MRRFHAFATIRSFILARPSNLFPNERHNFPTFFCWLILSFGAIVVPLYHLLKAQFNVIRLGRAIGAFTAIFFLISQPFAAQEVRIHRAPRLIIQPKAGVTQAQIDALQERHRTLKNLNAPGRMRLVELDPSERLEQALQRFRGSDLVEFAEPDHLLRSTVTPNDPHFANGNQWSLRNGSTGRDISAVTAWDVARYASNIVVAIVDSGIRYTHEDLAPNMWRNPGEIPGNGQDDDENGLVDDVHGINTVIGTGNPMDDADHGTHVAGIIGAVGDNGKGITGVAWNVKLMACKFLAADGFGFTSDAVEAIDYARRMGAHVINASFGGEEYSQALFNAIQQARNAGIIFVAAAGNEQLNTDAVPMYPASYGLDNIIVVGGSTDADTFDSSYSNYGVNSVDLFAPGTDIYSTWGSSDTAYQYSTGTSMAAPHVAGAAALMMARFTNLTSAQIISRILASVDVRSSFNNRCKTGGRFNLRKALGPDPWANFGASAWMGEPPLSVSFSNLSIGNITSQSWDFGDGSDPTDAASPSHVFSKPGEYDVRLTVVGSNGESDTVIQKVRVVSNYQFRSEPYSWVSHTGMTKLTLTDNGVSAAQNIPFSFPFYGVAQNSIRISANGLLGFSADGLSSGGNVSLPSANAPNGIIAPFWEDLNPSNPVAGVYVGTVGSAPNRRFVATWLNVPRVANGALMSFQAILEEASGEMVFQYRTTDGGRSATIGVENYAADIGAQYLFNGSPRTVANSTALRVGRKIFRYLTVKQSKLNFDVAPGSSLPALVLDLENVGNTNLNFSVESSSPWLSISSGSGSLTGGEKRQLEVQLTPAALALPSGNYDASLEVQNTTDGGGNVSLPVSIQVQGGAAVLEFTPGMEIQFTGGVGGPFQPEDLSVELRNSGSVPLEWSSSPSASWMRATPSSGTIDPGQSITVSVGISTNAALLTEGTYDGSIQFRNNAAPDTQSFPQSVHLLINGRVESSSIQILDGEFRAEITAPQPGDYAVEYSLDLTTWQTLTTAPTQNGAVSFSDPLEAGTQRFYRLRRL